MLPEDYLFGLLGGLTIGVAGVIYLLGNGKIMGASGIIGGLVDGSARADWQQRLLFVVALVLAPWAVLQMVGVQAETKHYEQCPGDRSRRISGGFGHADCQRVHQWSRGLRNLPSVTAWNRVYGSISSGRRCRSCSFPSSFGSRLMRSLFTILAGGLFGLGLLVSGMTDTRKIQGWLDVFGNWDPTLAFVMGGAIVPMFFAWRIAGRRHAPVIGGSFPAMPEQKISRDLALGSVLFGMGWGLSGLCPGPSLASLTFGGWQGLLFLVAMVLGMLAAVPAKQSRFLAPKVA